MSTLAKAMWRQAGRDLEHARKDLADAFYEWATYSAQQAAEKAIKAVLLGAGGSAPYSHGMNTLLDAVVGKGLATPEEKAGLQDALRALDIGFAVSRYPQAELGIAPADLVDERQARGAVAAAERVIAFASSRGTDRL